MGEGELETNDTTKPAVALKSVTGTIYDFDYGVPLRLRFAASCVYGL